MKPKRNILLTVLSHPDRYPLQYFWLNFIVITPVIGLAVNGFSGILFEKICGKLNGVLGLSKAWWQVTFSILCLIFVVLLAINIQQQFQRLKTIFSDEPELDTSVSSLKDTFRGLIAIASTRSPKFESPAESAIWHHWQKTPRQLEYCWLICSQDALKSIHHVIEGLIAKGVPIKVWRHDGSMYQLQRDEPKEKRLELYLTPTKQMQMQNGSDADLAHDPKYMRELVDSIYRDATDEMGLAEQSIVADYTGGTKSMTAGMVLACLSPNRRLQYIWNEFNEDRSIKRADFCEVMVSYKIKPIRSR
jgi:hypothetical protein